MIKDVGLDRIKLVILLYEGMLYEKRSIKMDLLEIENIRKDELGMDSCECKGRIINDKRRFDFFFLLGEMFL